MYDDTFYDYIQVGSLNSARVVAPLLIEALELKSVLDVGCGAGAWLREYGNCGVTDVAGVDGDYVSREQLLIPSEHFIGHDLTASFDLDRSFDLVQCLEVAEHLPKQSSETLIATLVRHSEKILFSAAVPGQGGENHINEQPLEFWRAKFAKHGYIPFDFVRGALKNDARVAPWYRYNVLLYVHESATRELPDSIRSTRIAPDERIRDVSPLYYRLQKLILRQFPPSLSTLLAIQKHRLVLWTRQRG
jgi:SAM-dependent methyltransferase